MLELRSGKQTLCVRTKTIQLLCDRIFQEYERFHGSLLDQCANLELWFYTKGSITVESEEQALQTLMSQFHLLMDLSVVVNKQVTDAVKKRSIEKIIKRLQMAYFPDEQQSNCRNCFMSTTDQNNKQRQVIPVGFGN